MELPFFAYMLFFSKYTLSMSLFCVVLYQLIGKVSSRVRLLGAGLPGSGPNRLPAQHRQDLDDKGGSLRVVLQYAGVPG